MGVTGISYRSLNLSITIDKMSHIPSNQHKFVRYVTSHLLFTHFVYDNKKFWKQIKSFFSDKSQSFNNITLVENNKIISDPEKCAEIMNNFFIDSVMELDIDRELHKRY